MNCPNIAKSLKIVILRRAHFARRRICPELAEGTCGSHRDATRCLRRYKREATFLIVPVLLLLASFAVAQTLTGTLKNSTTGKPAAGDEVVLLKLGQGMEEAGRTKTDAKGNFSFTLDAQSPHLVRAIHQGVTYHRMAPPGTTSVEVEVYDVGKKIEGIGTVADIMRFQAGQGQLEVQRVFAVQNSSKPPRTQMNERNLEFYVPDGARIVEGSAMTAGGQPVNSAPVAEGDKNRYSFIFPLRPGETRFQVVYQLPYTGSANIDPKPVSPLQHFVAVVPKSMQFTAAPGATFQQLTDPDQPGVVMQVASSAAPGQPLAFRITGEGSFPSAAEERAQSGGAQGQGRGQEQEQAQSEGAPAQSANRPGGGLGPPIDAPDPLQKYRWYILGGFAAVLIAGAVFVASRQQSAARAASRSKSPRAVEYLDNDQYADDDAGRELAQVSARELASKPRMAAASSSPSLSSPPSSSSSGLPPIAPASSSANHSSMLLEALKEELFQLEVEHKQGRISGQEYETARAALDQTLERALKRVAQKT